MEHSERLRAILSRLGGLKVLAVGDIYLDENVFGVVNEVSLEAPIPVLEVRERRYNPGAAGNAACNTASLGGPVVMVGVVGADVNAGIVKQEFEKRGVDTAGIVTDPARPTNTYGKLRAGGHNTPLQEMLRTDTPRPVPISGAVEAAVVANIRQYAPDCQAILIGDQVGSVITPAVLDAIRDMAQAHGLVTVADSRDRAGMFDGIDIIVPNDTEAGRAAGIEIADEATLLAAGGALLKSARNVFITRGPHGISVFAEDGSHTHVPAGPVNAVDVTGAGDTVAAMTVLARAAGATLEDCAFLANTAAGLAVVQEGVVTISRAEVEAALSGRQGPAKLKTLEALQPMVRKLQGEGKRVVWTNGCFDILHVGHITYLIAARREGDVMVLGLNSDASVRAIKGPTRPVIGEDDRALVLSALACVDYLVLFDDPSPYQLIETLKPDVYVKGGDYTIDTIDQQERKLVEGHGGRIAILPGVDGHSTTNIIDKITREAETTQEV
ncbi:MAG: D-glycero-beta-D-manno-heptose 1-phosphate adenylyltransferase [Candidatus Hydrogenedens sp.]|nr:D-glycero-beta-D-manno-heptose 1-phosphate adenylyltransferase [Candidatus Hydrogenedens sp.]